ncbi:uncharacterized protein C9orf85 homolog isoform X4 [Pyrgilauda ruficollis]|nr:uncharacterized protein C9orf85 homolog isoform X3 [Pyrgilauda ruficollis]XP_041314348.1 uncharacterized protein C9orf85 homolog isoform X3 [Pyrgilauda ruficollis]XP_041314349.1 uncharacterized protein C9orf85 homolog isoform X3 [Pyrgilauda ruficollis]XP_041314350.1 uncharacterized protein C9orf85 homolog isoform X4 [Pyrgilauda ruficollis]XP_041314351.1 uncharacterized protein C9orf85 homolog isoform X3 [Pyrgilauda ruficollis]XP_041314352.1 uncharacterized protein C9orf85 homolog isoform X4
MLRPAPLPPSIAEAEGINLTRLAGTKLTPLGSASEKGSAEVLSSDSKALFGAAKSQTLTRVSQVSAPVSNKGVQGKTTETGAPDRSPTSPGHPGAGDTPRDPRAQRHRDAGRRLAGPAAPRPVRAADRSRAARPSEETPVAAAGLSARPRGRHTPAPGARTGRGSERGKRHGRTREDETSRPHAAAAGHPHTVHPRDAGGGRPLPAPGAPLGGPALSRLPGRRDLGAPAVLSNGAAGGGRQRPVPAGERAALAALSPPRAASGAAPAGPQRQWGRSRGGAAQRGRPAERFRGTRRRPGMSSERGNVSRTRPQRHQNARAFENDKYDTSARRKKINAKLHDGVCQHCKGILEWRVKFRKYKLLTKPKK